MIDIFLGGILKKQVGFYYWGISLTKSILATLRVQQAQGELRRQ